MYKFIHVFKLEIYVSPGSKEKYITFTQDAGDDVLELPDLCRVATPTS